MHRVLTSRIASIDVKLCGRNVDALKEKPKESTCLHKCKKGAHLDGRQAGPIL